MPDKIDKLAQLMHNDSKALRQEIRNLAESVLMRQAPRVNVKPPEVTVNADNLRIPEIKAPEVKIPKIDVGPISQAIANLKASFRAEKTEIDLSKVEKLLNQLVKKEQTEDSSDKLLSKMEELISRIPIPKEIDLEPLVKELGKIKSTNTQYKGGGIGPSKRFVLNKSGEAVDPSEGTAEGKAPSTGMPVMGLDDEGKAQYVSISGPEGDLLKTQTEWGHLLKEILVELKINNKHLEQLSEVGFEEHNIEK